MNELIEIRLKNPFGDKSAIFNLNPKIQIPDETNEILQIIKFISEDFDDVKPILDKYYESNKIIKSHENIIDLSNRFNEWSSKLNQDEINSKKSSTYASSELIKFLMSFIYNRSVLEPDKLNHYEPFSPQVYGETSFDLIDQLIKRIKLQKSDVFVDLGSGVGNVVLHVAAAAECKICYGFEKAEWPAYFAKKMEAEFKYWMNFFGKKYSDFKLYKADFLSDEEFVDVEFIDPSTRNTITKKVTMNDYVKDVINEANLIFVNNYAFGAEVDHQLKLRFCNMLEGSFIVSSKPFCPLNFRINSRNLNDIGTILNVSEFEPLNGKVSWTDRPISYYFHKIDRTLLEKYFERLKNPSKSKDEQDDEKPKSNKPLSPMPCVAPTNGQHDSSYSVSTPSPSIQSSPDATKEIKKLSKEEENSTKRKHRKSKQDRTVESKSKRKSTSNNSDNTSITRSTSNKRARLSKKEKKSTKVDKKNRSKSLDKNCLKTLDAMHAYVKKSSKEAPALNNNSTLNSSDIINLKNFNISKMTNLEDENLDNKLLKDCKISPKIYRQFKNSKIDKNPLSKSKLNGDSYDFDDALVRRELGDEVVDLIEDYLKTCKREYISFLMYTKATRFTDKIKMEIENELKIKNDLMLKIQKLENDTAELMKKNVNLLKTKTSELEIKDLNTSAELFECAKVVLKQHETLVQKAKDLEQAIHNLEKNSINNSNMNIENSLIKHEVGDEIKQTAILSKLLNKLESSILNGKNSSSSKSNEMEKNENAKNDESIETSSKKDDESSVNSNKNNQVINDIKSIESNETLTATERDDCENEENLSDDLNEESVTKENKKVENNTRRASVNSNKSDISNDSKKIILKKKDSTKFSHKNENKKSVSTGSANNLNQSSNTVNNKPLFDQIWGKDSDKKTESLKNFKIPKQNSQEKFQVTHSPVTDFSPSTTSNFNKEFLETNEYSMHNRIDSYVSKNKSYSPYHNPKRNQFKQYMMESSNNIEDKNIINNNKSSYFDYNNTRHNDPHFKQNSNNNYKNEHYHRNGLMMHGSPKSSSYQQYVNKTNGFPKSGSYSNYSNNNESYDHYNMKNRSSSYGPHEHQHHDQQPGTKSNFYQNYYKKN